MSVFPSVGLDTVCVPLDQLWGINIICIGYKSLLKTFLAAETAQMFKLWFDKPSLLHPQCGNWYHRRWLGLFSSHKKTLTWSDRCFSLTLTHWTVLMYVAVCSATGADKIPVQLTDWTTLDLAGQGYLCVFFFFPLLLLGVGERLYRIREGCFPSVTNMHSCLFKSTKRWKSVGLPRLMGLYQELL